MGILVYVLGRSGTGKSYSMRNFDKKKLGVINVQGKILPFKGSGAIETINTDQSDLIVKSLRQLANTYKSIVVDDYQYIMANEFMRRAAERGFDKFTEIARHAWDIADCVRTLPNDVIVYIMCHTDTDSEGTERLKTIGKLLDEKICLEGMSTIVLKTNVSDGTYTFLTQNNGKDTVKSPAGMFPSYAIDNDLNYVDQKIRNYYELGEFLTDEEMKEIDEQAKNEDIPIKEEKPRRRRKAAEETEEPAKPRTRRKKDGLDTLSEKEEKDDQLSFGEDAFKAPEPEAESELAEELPKRKRRTAEPAETEAETADAAPVRRRRRRTE